jgi:hypothetical protein
MSWTSFAQTVGQAGEDAGTAYKERRDFKLREEYTQGQLAHLKAIEEQARAGQKLQREMFESGMWENAGQTYDPTSGQMATVLRNKRDGTVKVVPVPGLNPSSPAATLDQLNRLFESQGIQVPEGVKQALVLKSMGISPTAAINTKVVQRGDQLYYVRMNEITNDVMDVTDANGQPVQPANWGQIFSATDPFTGKLQTTGPQSRIIPNSGQPPVTSPRSAAPGAINSPLPTPPAGVQARLPKKTSGRRQGGGGIQAGLPFDPNLIAQEIARDPGAWEKVQANQITAVQQAARNQGLQLPPIGAAEGKKAYDDALAADMRLWQMKQQAADPTGASDMALLFNHISMTIGGVKGGRVTEAEIQNHLRARTLPEHLLVQYEKLASGEQLSPQQRQNFVKLGQEVRAAAWMEARRKAQMSGYNMEPAPFPGLPSLPEDPATLRKVPIGSSGQGQTAAAPTANAEIPKAVQPYVSTPGKRKVTLKDGSVWIVGDGSAVRQ